MHRLGQSQRLFLFLALASTTVMVEAREKPSPSRHSNSLAFLRRSSWARFALLEISTPSRVSFLSAYDALGLPIMRSVRPRYSSVCLSKTTGTVSSSLTSSSADSFALKSVLTTHPGLRLTDSVLTLLIACSLICSNLSVSIVATFPAYCSSRSTRRFRYRSR